MLRIDDSKKFVLASASPRRRELLSACGIDFVCASSDVDERVLPSELPQNLVERLSKAKADVGAQKYPDAWVLGADTIVVVDGEILGKPENTLDAAQMLRKLQGRTHEVWGGFTVLNRAQSYVYTSSHRTLVEMIPLTARQIEEYIATGEPMDKAGSYAIQGIGAHLITQVEGSYTNVVGLNLSAVISVLRQCKIIG